MSMSRRVATLFCLILVMALGIAAPGATAVAQPGMTAPAATTQPAATAPAATPDRRAQPASMPPVTSEYPPLPPPPSTAGNVPTQPRGVLAPGATVPAAEQPRPAPRYESYRALAFLGDLAWFWASYRLIDSDSELAPLVAVGGYVVTVPLIHAFQGNSRSAWISGGVRAAALGLTMGSVVATIGSSCNDGCPAMGLAFTGIIGMGSIMVADWFVLSRKEIPPETPVRGHGAQPGWTVLPHVQLGHESVHVGVGGSF